MYVCTKKNYNIQPDISDLQTETPKGSKKASFHGGGKWVY